MPPYCNKIHDEYHEECGVNSMREVPFVEPLEYPSNLNVSALKFDSSCDLKQLSTFGGDCVTNDSVVGGIKCGSGSCTLLDDVTLLRLSSVLAVSLLSTKNCNSCDRGDDAGSIHDLQRTFDEQAIHSAVLSHLHDTAVVLPSLLSASVGGKSVTTGCQESKSKGRTGNSVADFLEHVGIDEVESLGNTSSRPSAGQCQFSSIAMALTRNSSLPLQSDFRPDLELRQLALHTISSNPPLYNDFLLAAGFGRRTRAASRLSGDIGGRGVDLACYLRTMSNPGCYGDAVTLQALCDALKLTIRIVKPVEADAYQEEWQHKKLKAAVRKGLADMVTDGNELLEFGATTGLEDFSSSIESCPSCHSKRSFDENDMNNESSSTVYVQRGQHGKCKEQRLYVSHEFQPRFLPKIDSRIKDVQKVTRGRLVWLSHIGDESHYRYLRPSGMKKVNKKPHDSLSQDSIPIGERQMAARARRSRLFRLWSLCQLKDGYIRTSSLSSSLVTVEGEVFPSLNALNARNEVCGLCFQEARGIAESVRDGSGKCSGVLGVSPSSCHHKFCRDCLLRWVCNFGNNCPVCGAAFFDIFDVDTKSVSSTVLEAVVSKFDSLSQRVPLLPITAFPKVKDMLVRMRKLESMNTRRSKFADITHRLYDAVEKKLAEITSNSDQSERKVEDMTGSTSEFVADLYGFVKDGGDDVTSFLRHLLNAGLMLALRVILTPISGARMEILSLSIIAEKCVRVCLLIENLYWENQQVLSMNHLLWSEGVPEVIVSYRGYGSKSRMDDTRCLLHMWSNRFFFIRQIKAGEKSRRKAGCHLVSACNATKQSHPDSLAVGRNGNGISNDRDKEPKSLRCKKKKRNFADNEKKLKKHKRVKIGKIAKNINPQITAPATPPAPVVVRARGKRQVRPVETTNISREHLGLRTYEGAV